MRSSAPAPRAYAFAVVTCALWGVNEDDNLADDRARGFGRIYHLFGTAGRPAGATDEDAPKSVERRRNRGAALPRVGHSLEGPGADRRGAQGGHEIRALEHLRLP